MTHPLSGAGEQQAGDWEEETTPGPLQSNRLSWEAALQMERLARDLRSMYREQRCLESSPNPRPRKILIVEDQDEVRRLIRMTVQFEDHEVFEADSGDSGLAMALEIKPDLVLLDIMLPGALDGLHVCRAIKAGPTPPPVLLITALGGRSRVMAGQKAGADAYLLKPFSPLQLIDTINRLLGID